MASSYHSQGVAEDHKGVESEVILRYALPLVTTSRGLMQMLEWGTNSAAPSVRPPNYLQSLHVPTAFVEMEEYIRRRMLLLRGKETFV